MKKKPKAYSLSQEVIEAVSQSSINMSSKKGKKISDSEIVETLLRKGLKLDKSNKS